MAWNEIQAKDDPQLSFQAYYVRLNALRQLLSPLSADLFSRAWESARSRKMVEFRRSAIAGRVVADLIRALALEEVTRGDTKPGNWFVHSGVTRYTNEASSIRTATITLKNKKTLAAAVRRDCEITPTASVNMVGDDDISLVVGRLSSDTKFDLVAAGYRDPVAGFMQSRSREWSTPTASALDTVLRLPRIPGLPRIEFVGRPDNEVLLEAALDSIGRFVKAVENQGVWKQLYDPNHQPAHESRHQALFRLLANVSFDALDIQTHPGADHGSGATDITISLGRSIGVIEFKKDHSLPYLRHGLSVQLPAYMRSAGAVLGFFLVMCHNTSTDRVQAELEQHMRELDGKVDGTVIVVPVDCRRQNSGSKRRD